MSEDEDLTEHEWLTCTDPARMLGHLFPSNSDRRDRLFAIACCRRIWHLIEDPRSRHAVETAERFVEGLADENELQAAAEQAMSKESGGGCSFPAELAPHPAEAAFCAAAYNCQRGAFDAAWHATCAVGDVTREREGWDEVGRAEQAAQAELIRCIVGNPFHPLPSLAEVADDEFVRLAARVYEDRGLPSGLLDPVACAVLADALEERGGSAPFLDHLRAAVPHVRGCFVLDAILDKPRTSSRRSRSSGSSQTA